MADAPSIANGQVPGHVLRLRRFIAGCMLVLLTTLGAFPAQFSKTTDPAKEYGVKAAYLLNFLRFTEWPAGRVPAGAPMTLGIVGSPETRKIISESLKGKTVGDHGIEILDLTTAEEMAPCHIVFIPRNSSVAEPTVFSATASRPILVVGETDDFAVNGGMVGFVLRGDNVRFQVNLPAIQAAGLKISSKVASVAELVKSSTP